MLALMSHLLYLRSRLGQTSLVGLNALPLYIEEKFIKRVALGTPGNTVNSTVKKDLFAGLLWKTQRLTVIAVILVEGVRVRAAKGVGIPPVHLFHLAIFVHVGLKS